MPSQPHSKSGRLTRLVPLAAILIIAFLGAVLLADHVSFETLSHHNEAMLAFRDAHYGVAILAFVVLYTLIVIFSLPGAAMASIIGGYLFSLFPGVFFNMIAATLGATFVFLAARWGIGSSISEKMENSEGALKKIKSGINDNQWSFLLMLRLVPIFPFFLVNLLLSTVGVSLRRFVASTFIGITPGALVYTSVGAGAGEVIARGETPNLGIIFEPHILLPILGLAALAALPVFMKLFKREAQA